MTRRLTDQEILDTAVIANPFELERADRATERMQALVIALLASGFTACVVLWPNQPEPMVGLCGLEPDQCRPDDEQVIDICRALSVWNETEDASEELPDGSAH
jgi:hypothetical protein